MSDARIVDANNVPFPGGLVRANMALLCRIMVDADEARRDSLARSGRKTETDP